MEIEDFLKLEEKVNHLVETLKVLKAENIRLNSEIEKLKKDSTVISKERVEVKQKITALIEMIDSIDK